MDYNTFDIFKNMRKKKDRYDFLKKKEALFPDSFAGLIVGKPGSGKSTLIEKMLNHDKCLQGKFDIVLIISPTRIGGIKYNQEYWTKEFSIQWILQRAAHFRDLNDYEKELKSMEESKASRNRKKNIYKSKHKEILNKTQSGYNSDISSSNESSDSDGRKRFVTKPSNRRRVHNSESDEESEKDESHDGDALSYVMDENEYDPEDSGLTDNNKTQYKALVIIDDKIADLKAAENNTELQNLFYNRRGIVKNVCLSFLVTSQTFKRFPLKFRNTLTFIIVFNVGPTEIDSICKEQVYDANKRVVENIQRHFKKDDHNFVFIRFDKYFVFLNFETNIT